MSEREAIKLVDQVLARHGEITQDSQIGQGKTLLREQRVQKALEQKKGERKQCTVSR